MGNFSLFVYRPRYTNEEVTNHSGNDTGKEITFELSQFILKKNLDKVATCK